MEMFYILILALKKNYTFAKLTNMSTLKINKFCIGKLYLSKSEENTM